MSAEAKIDALIHVAGRLIEVMNQEIEVLRGMRVADLAPIQQEKNSLADDYEASVRDLQADPDAILAVSDSLRREFAEIASRLNGTLMENERALHAAQVAHDRVLNAIVRAVEQTRPTLNTYTPDGTAALAGSSTHRYAAPLSLDTSL